MEKVYITAIPKDVIEEISKADPEAVRLRCLPTNQRCFNICRPTASRPTFTGRELDRQHLLQYLVTLGVPGFNANAPETKKLRRRWKRSLVAQMSKLAALGPARWRLRQGSENKCYHIERCNLTDWKSK
ncbi:hypothetical protein U1Q18_052173 [Sarracenia purpurea var. burkii]